MQGKQSSHIGVRIIKEQTIDEPYTAIYANRKIEKSDKSEQSYQ